MVLKKQTYTEEEIPIFDEAVIYKRGEYWQFRMWLNDEQKYARKSLRTRSQTTAIEKAKAYYLEILANKKVGKKYFFTNDERRRRKVSCTARKRRANGIDSKWAFINYKDSFTALFISYW